MKNLLFVYGGDAFAVKKILSAALAEIGSVVDSVFENADDGVLISSLKGRLGRVFIVGKDRKEFYQRLKNERIDRLIDENVYIFDRLTDKETSELVTALKRRSGLTEDRTVFKLYGVSVKALEDFFRGFDFIGKDIGYSVFEENGDIRLNILLKKGYSPTELDLIEKGLLTKFRDFVYATADASLAQTLVDILRIHGRKISVAESMTGGSIASAIVKIAGASEVLYEGLVTYDTLAKERRLGVRSETVMRNTVVSAEVAFEMVRSLVGDNSSVGISVTGYAPSKTENADDGLCFIGVALDERTIVDRFVFSGDRKTVIEKATNAGIFLAIKILTDKFFKG